MLVAREPTQSLGAGLVGALLLLADSRRRSTHGERATGYGCRKEHGKLFASRDPLLEQTRSSVRPVKPSDPLFDSLMLPRGPS